MKTTCARPTVMYYLLGKKTPTGKKFILQGFPPAGTKYELILRDCGSCIGCKLRRRMDLALRLEHESYDEFNEFAWFVTATYDDENMPYGGSLVADHMSDLIRSLRQILKRKGLKVKVRFFGVGEYGEETNRPHYHFVLYGCDFPDKTLSYEKPCRNLYSKELQLLTGLTAGLKYYESETLTRAWGKGFIQLTSVSEATMQYVAKFHIEKVTGELAEDHYTRAIPETGELVQVEPESSRMSRNPGIGRKWIEKYWEDVYPDGYITTKDGGKIAPPKYYDRWLEENHPDMYAEVKERREKDIDLELEIAKRREDIDKCRSAQLSINKQKRQGR